MILIINRPVNKIATYNIFRNHKKAMLFATSLGVTGLSRIAEASHGNYPVKTGRVEIINGRPEIIEHR